MARKINSRQIKQPQKRVIGAGITEFWYLKHLKPLLGFVYDLNSAEQNLIRNPSS